MLLGSLFNKLLSPYYRCDTIHACDKFNLEGVDKNEKNHSEGCKAVN